MQRKWKKGDASWKNKSKVWRVKFSHTARVRFKVFDLSSKRDSLFLLQMVANVWFGRIVPSPVPSQFLELSKLFQAGMNWETRRYHANEFIKEVSKFQPREVIYNRMNRVVRERTEVFYDGASTSILTAKPIAIFSSRFTRKFYFFNAKVTLLSKGYIWKTEENFYLS